MKYLILFCIILFALPGFGQQDSVVYEKRKNTLETYKSDSIYYRVVYTKSGDALMIYSAPFTDVDSLVYLSLYNNFLDASRQYRVALLNWEDAEKGYLLRIRQAEKQYLQFAKKNLKDVVQQDVVKDTVFAKEIIGAWLLNEKKVEVEKDYIIDKQPIRFLSTSQFQVIVGEDDVTFFQVNPRRWQSKDSKYVLRRDDKTKKDEVKKADVKLGKTVKKRG